MVHVTGTSRPSPRAWAAALAVLLSSCGAKTALDARELDAATAFDAGDAGVFRTFPCRWSPEPPVEPPLGEIEAAAISAELERIALVGPDPDSGRLVWLSYVPRATPVLEGTFDVPWSGSTRGLAPRRGGWLALAWDREAAACDLHWLSPAREIERSERWGGAIEGCSIEAVDPDHVVLGLTRSSEDRAIVFLDLAEGSRRVLERRDPQPSGATRDDYGIEYVVTPIGLTWSATARTVVGAEVSTTWPLPGSPDVQLAPDRLLGGALVLTDSRGELHLDRLRVEETFLARERVASLGGFRDELDLATNETEALFSLRDGTFVAIPVHSGDVRRFAPPPGVVRDPRVVLAPGASIAVQSWRDERPRPLLRSLVCNR